MIQLARYPFRPGFVHLVEGHQSVIMFVRRDTSLIQNSSQGLAMVQTNREILKSEADQRITRGRDQFSFDHHRKRSEHVHIALVKLAKAAPRGAIGAPDGLNLIALEKLWQFVLILGDDARQRHCQIVAQSEVGLAGLLVLAALEDFEDELIAFFTVLAHQGLDVFDGGSFQRLETVALVHFFDYADDILTLTHIGGQKVTHAARGLGLG